MFCKHRNRFSEEDDGETDHCEGISGVTGVHSHHCSNPHSSPASIAGSASSFAGDPKLEKQCMSVRLYLHISIYDILQHSSTTYNITYSML